MGLSLCKKYGSLSRMPASLLPAQKVATFFLFFLIDGGGSPASFLAFPVEESKIDRLAVSNNSYGTRERKGIFVVTLRLQYWSDLFIPG